jgi:hypothetical protein
MRWSLCYHKSGGESALLHACHSEAQTVILIRRNSEIDDVAQGKCDTKDSDIISHATDNEAWEALDHFDPEFARDSKSVRLGLLMDGFQPHSEASSLYSCWLVFIMPYILSPNKYLKQGFIFLALIIPGPKEPKKQMNVLLHPLM